MAKFCRYCGKQLQDNELCSCRANTATGNSTGNYTKEETNQKTSSNKKIFEVENNERLKKLSQINIQEQNLKDLLYTNTIKKRISFTYAAAIIISLIIGFILLENFLSFAGANGSITGWSYIFLLIIVEVFIVSFGCRIANFLVARLGMQMEMSYNLNISRMYLKNIEELLFKLYNDKENNGS